MEERVAYEPDLFIIYCGHNEFLEDRTYGELMDMPSAVRGLQASLSNSRTYSLLSRMIKGGKSPGKASELRSEVSTKLDTIGTEAYHRDAGWQKQVTAHYRFNLARMVDIARANGAEVVFVMPGSNLRNSSPFKSQHRDLGAFIRLETSRRRTGDRVRAGRNAVRNVEFHHRLG